MAEFSTETIIYISAEAIVGFVTVVGNAIVLAAIISHEYLHSITNVFIGSLAAADLCVGLFAVPSAVLAILGLPGDKYGCLLINCVHLMFTNVSMFMLLSIALERFFAIRFPFEYRLHATSERAILSSLTMWIVGFVLGLIPMWFVWNAAPDDLSHCSFTEVLDMKYVVYFQFFSVTLSSLFLMSLIYVCIFFIVRHHARQARIMENMFQCSLSVPRGSRRLDKDVKAAKMFATLVFLFGLLCLPINIINSIKLFHPTFIISHEVLLTTIVLSHANSGVNPFLYAANDTRIRIAIKDMLYIQRSPEDLQFSSYSHTPTPHCQRFKSVSNAMELTVEPQEQSLVVGVERKNDAQPPVQNKRSGLRRSNNAILKVSFARFNTKKISS